MKKTTTSYLFWVKRAIHRGMSFFLFLFLFGTAALAQNSNSLDEIGDLSTVKWKSQSDFDQSIVQEQGRVDALLAAPNLQAPDQALYLSYHRLLGYVNKDVQSGMPVLEAVTTNFDKVLTEAETDPDIKNMPPGSLFTLIPGLVEMLTEVPVAGQ